MTMQTRNERIYVRLTTEEAASIADAAALHGMTMSNFVRDAVLRRSGPHARVPRRMLASDAAEAVRSLSAIGVHLRELSDLLRAGRTLTTVQIDACLAEMHAALTRFEA